MKKIFIAAGGTGGHINAALSMGNEFSKNYEVIYLTGTRYLDYQLLKNEKVIHLNSVPLRSKNPFKILVSLFMNSLIFLKILGLYIKEKPRFIIGAGGYVCGPTLMAAKVLFKPIFIIEQNAIMGVTNKILSKFANIIFVNFKNTKGINSSDNRVKCVGNPIRASIKNTPNIFKEKLKILVFGGSLGATQINTVIQKIVKRDSLEVEIIHQVGKNNMQPDITQTKKVKYEQLEYIDDMAEKYNWANLIIARAGASTISELRVVKRPSLLIPFPHATDNHQYYNAVELKEENNFYVNVIDHQLNSDDLVEVLEKEILEIITNKEKYLISKDMNLNNTSLIIKEEIEKYVWS